MPSDRILAASEARCGPDGDEVADPGAYGGSVSDKSTAQSEGGIQNDGDK